MTVFPALAFLIAQSSNGGSSNPLGNPIIMMVLLIVMFYFLLIRPQQKQRKEQKARINSMAAGDHVVTAGGVHGLVHNIKDNTVVIKVAEGVMIEFEKSSVTGVHKKDVPQAVKKD